MEFHRVIATLSLIILTAFPAWSQTIEPPPSIPCRIGGTITINEQQVTDETDSGLVIIATRLDAPFNPPIKDEDGLNSYHFFGVDIPLSETSGVEPGDTIILHVFLNGSKLLVTSPAGGYVVVAPPENHFLEIHLKAISGPKLEPKYTEEELQRAVEDAERKVREKFDIHMDDRVGLPEAIHALRVIAGVPQ
ncbi:MAG: hypothetical protein ACOC3A_04425 [Thermodesulfobacteriota bacterium]